MLTSRPYEGHADLARMIALEAAIGGSSSPALPRWQPGDIVWVLYARGPGDDIRLWAEGDDLVAFAFMAPELYVEALPGHAAATAEAFDWAEARAREAVVDGASTPLSTFSLDSDVERNQLLAARGWRRTEAGGVRMRLSLVPEVQPARVPPGFRVRDCIDIDIEERAAAHRDAWSNLAHIGLPDARSAFSAGLYRKLRAAPGYDPSLDFAVETADGAIASCCICWADDANGVGHFEPVGTRAEFRRRGLARAMILEALHRLRDRGLHTALIGTARINHPARSTYLSCGFEIVDEDHEYVLDLN